MLDLEVTKTHLASQLKIGQIVGTSAQNAHQIAVRGNLLAYTASGGVVVCTLDSDNPSIVSQRFFCANISTNNSNNSSTSSANAYLNMAFPNELGPASEGAENKKDSFGFPVSQTAAIVAGSNVPQNDTLSADTSNNSQFNGSKLKDRVRSISCIALSPNKKVLAVGEAGYQPRILLFSLAPDLSSNPVAIIHEHTFGITSIAFSPDLKYFCSLGMVNDGFLNVWKYNSSFVYLHATNKCSSVINQLLWHENFIITLGLRLIKVWYHEPEEKDAANHGSTGPPKTLALKGRNVLLGSNINSNFICGHALNNDEVLLITDNNQFLLLKLTYDSLNVIPLEPPANEFNNIFVDYELLRLWFSSAGTEIDSIPIHDICHNKDVSQTPSSPSKLNMMIANPASSPHKSTFHDNNFQISCMIDYNEDYFIYMTTSEEIILRNKFQNDCEKKLVPSLLKNISGVTETFSRNLIAFSSDGVVKKIHESSENDYTCLDEVLQFNLPSSDVVQNGLTAANSSNITQNLYLGDKFGQLYILKLENEKLYSVQFQTKAHSSTVNDITYFEVENFEFICSVARDRMIQIFYKSPQSNWEILQTIPTHTGNLLKVEYKDSKVFVCSTDRTVSIHKVAIGEDGSVKVQQEKIITFKNSPLNMKIFGDDLIISTNDRSMLIYKANDTYELQRTLKLHNERNESLLVENYVVHHNVIFVLASDKSLRSFSYSTGKALSIAWGHLESILSLCMSSESENELYSISADGCLFKWKLAENQQKANSISHETHNTTANNSPVQDSVPLYSKVTRKIVPTVPSISSTQTPTKRRSFHFSNLDTHADTESRSPSPKLSNATLKRMEARKKQGELSPTKDVEQSQRLSRPSHLSLQPHNAASNQRPISPTRARSPSRVHLSPSKIQSSPSKPPRPNALVSPIKHGSGSIGVGHLSKKPLIDLLRNLSRKPSETDFAMHRAAIGTADAHAEDFMERSIAYLAIIKSRVNREQLTNDDKRKLKNELLGILELINEEADIDEVDLDVESDEENVTESMNKLKISNKENIPSTYVQNAILEKYSDKLVEMVREKLNKKDGFH